MKPTIKVITPATSFGLISLADCKLMLGIAAGDISGDPQLQLLIDQNSVRMATQCNRIFAEQKVLEIWRCTGPVCCPDGTCVIYLTHFPVAEAAIETVETPIGTLIDPSGWEVDEETGRLILFGGCSSEIAITYTGGYVLPDEAPLDLQQAAALRVQKFRSQQQQEATGGAGIRMIAHKDSRIMYFSPRDMAGGATTGTPQISGTDATVESILTKYTRYAI
jgi:hypothetical protein